MEIKRYTSLDAFRGLTIALMILVNTPGSFKFIYAPLRHAMWHGCTPTDLVFPFFLFIVGVAMWFSFKKFDHKPSLAALKKIIKRTIIIFAVGLALNAFPFYNLIIPKLRILGVLQRIALAYGIGAVACIYLTQKKQVFLTVFILGGYWIALLLTGGDNPFSRETNVVGQLDRLLLGAGHLHDRTSPAFDPEGLLSTLPAVVTVIFGYITGRAIGISQDKKKTITMMILWGILGILSGLLWGIFFPINKALWTSSYVLFTTGIALILLSFLVWLIDLKGFKKWAKSLLVFGTNSIFIYVVSILWAKIMVIIRLTIADGSKISLKAWIYQNVFVPWAGPLIGSLLFALTHIILFWLILLILYKKKIFIRI
jgi:predicted acyltransferase